MSLHLSSPSSSCSSSSSSFHGVCYGLLVFVLHMYSFLLFFLLFLHLRRLVSASAALFFIISRHPSSARNHHHHHHHHQRYSHTPTIPSLAAPSRLSPQRSLFIFTPSLLFSQVLPFLSTLAPPSSASLILFPSHPSSHPPPA